MKILFVAQDAAPSRAFQEFATALTGFEDRVRFETALLVADGKVFPATHAQITEAVLSSHFVLIGMSSMEKYARDEIFAAQEALRLGIPYGFYSDFPGCYNRTSFWPIEVAGGTSFYLAFNDTESRDARNTFTGATIYVVGSPQREKLAFPRYTRDDVRARLGIEPDERFALLAGGKSVFGNMCRVGTVLSALHYATKCSKMKFRLLYSAHPGDMLPRAVDQSNGKSIEVLKEIEDGSMVPFKFVPGEKDLSTNDMITGADIVFFGLTGTSAIEAAYQRVPVIQISTAFEQKKLVAETGLSVPEAVECGAARMFDCESGNIAELGTMTLLLSGDRPHSLRDFQEAAYPVPNKVGVAKRKAVESIADFVHRTVSAIR